MLTFQRLWYKLYDLGVFYRAYVDVYVGYPRNGPLIFQGSSTRHLQTSREFGLALVHCDLRDGDKFYIHYAIFGAVL